MAASDVRPTDDRGELRGLLALAVPLVATQVGAQLMPFVDTAVVGRLGAVPLAGVALANGIYLSISLIAIGGVMGLDPLVAQAFGAKNDGRAQRLLFQSAYLSGLLSALVVVPLALVPLALEPLGIAHDVSVVVRQYVWIRLVGLFPMLMFYGSRSYLQAIGRTRELVLSTLIANGLNLAFDIVLVFGGGALPEWTGPLRHLPAFGANGSAWATNICTFAQWGLLALGIRALHRTPPNPEARKLDPDAIRAALKVGLPIGLQLAAETGVFALVGFFAGRLGADALAAHQIALTLASMTFMVAVGLGTAASVRVGSAIGARNPTRTRRAGFTAFAAAFSFMACSALAFFLFPEAIVRIVTDKQDLVRTAIPLMGVAAAFQISDGLQAVGSGVLRGAGDTRFSFLANVFGHWAVGLPIAVWLGMFHGEGLLGLWYGLAAGLSAVAIALFVRFALLSKNEIAPLR